MYVRLISVPEAPKHRLGLVTPNAPRPSNFRPYHSLSAAEHQILSTKSMQRSQCSTVDRELDKFVSIESSSSTGMRKSQVNISTDHLPLGYNP